VILLIGMEFYQKNWLIGLNKILKEEVCIMKIIATSNYNLDDYSEYIIAENLNSYYGKLICDFLQKSS